jgi:hypothetical protein
VRLPRHVGEYYSVETRNGDFKVRTVTGAELPVTRSHLIALEAEEVADETRERATLGLLTLRVRKRDGCTERE